MTLKLSRRQFGLGMVASALIFLASYNNLEGFCSEPSESPVAMVNYQTSNGINYTKIRERTATKLGNETVKAELGLESKLWENLKPGMTKQEVYDLIKQSPIELKTTTIFGGISGIRGYINSEDIRLEFLSAADRFIKSKPSSYDPTLTFSKEDKAILEKMLDRELKSSLTQTLGSWNPFSSGKEVYVYPPKSQIILRTDRDGNPCFEMLTNISKDLEGDPCYERLEVGKISDLAEKEVFRKFLLLSILSKDPDKNVPIDNIYREYQNKKS